MKKHLIFMAAGLLFLTACSGGNSNKAEEDSLKIALIRAQYEEVLTYNDSLMLLMGEIYNGIDSINMQEGLLYNMGQGESFNRRAEVRRNLSAIKERLAQNKQALSDMESKLQARGYENSTLKKTIEQMKQRIAEQDEKILALENDLAIAHQVIEGLSEQVAATQMIAESEAAAKEEAIMAYNEAENAANTVYYAIGTNKELKQNGLLEKKFLGQTKVLRGDFNESYFTKADKRTLSEINTGGKKVKIWTNMPQNSYSIDGGTIRILNPNEFWSLSRYLVIQIN